MFQRFLSQIPQGMKLPAVDAELWRKLVIAGLGLGAGLVLLPLGVVLLKSLAPIGTTTLWPTALTLANYQQAWERGQFLLAFANSTLVALAVTGFQALTSALAG